MKAMVLNKCAGLEERPLEFMDVSLPEPGDHDVLLKVNVCGMCHTDLHVIEGELGAPKLPLIPGHQVVGRVERIGAKVSKFRLGERVGVPWLYSTCGECRFCRSGRENLCTSALFTGYTADGGYCEYMKIHEDFLYSLPGDLSDEEIAPLLCAGVIGFRAFKLAELREGEKLGLFGFGASAHIVAQIANHKKIRVFAFSRNSEHRKHAIELGAEWTGTAEENPPENLDGAIIFAPAGELVPLALRKLDRGGRLILAGIHMSPIPEMDYSLLYYERSVKSAANTGREDVKEFLKIAMEIPVKTTVEVFPLIEANRALLRLKHGQIKGAGVLKV